MKITDINEIKAAIKNFKPSADGAYATCRSLPGQYAQENQQEWAERGTIEGKAARVFYLFENSEAAVEDGADMPFDAGHITHIEIEDEMKTYKIAHAKKLLSGWDLEFSSYGDFFADEKEAQEEANVKNNKLMQSYADCNGMDLQDFIDSGRAKEIEEYYHVIEVSE